MRLGEGKTTVANDGFFLERLDAFLAKNLVDIGAFAQREGRSSDEIRRHVAEWHCKFLFETNEIPSQSRDTGRDRVSTTLQTVSEHLESLRNIAGRHSFLLVVDPANDSDDGFLGGTILGREFWRGLRGGGTAGARAFKDRCRAEIVQINDRNPNSLANPDSASRRTPALAMKYNLYTDMRAALRSVSGIRNAEMKWSKPEKLEIYGVKLLGWPSNIVFKNPSQMSLKETTSLVELLRNNTLRFQQMASPYDYSPLGPSAKTVTSIERSQTDRPSNIEAEADLSWACNDEVLSTGYLPERMAVGSSTVHLQTPTRSIHLPASAVMQSALQPPDDAQSSAQGTPSQPSSLTMAVHLSLERSATKSTSLAHHPPAQSSTFGAYHGPQTVDGPIFAKVSPQKRKRPRRKSDALTS